MAASGLVYLAAAALEKPRLAWPVFILSVVIIETAKLGWIGYDATWALLVLAALFAAYGLLRDTTHSAGGLPLQAVGMICFGALAAFALYLNDVAGAYLVAVGLFAHAAWDVYHHRVGKVVSRSMSEFCFVLDTVLGAAILATVWR